jgi:hypothetical protein
MIRLVGLVLLLGVVGVGVGQGASGSSGGAASAPASRALNPIQTMFDFSEDVAEALAFVCSATNGGALGTVDIAGMRIQIPGIKELLSGLDLRPLCQYADIVAKTTRMVNGVLNGALNSTEAFINEGLSLVARSIGGSVNFEGANDFIAGLGAQLEGAMDLGPRALEQYRSTLREGLSAGRSRALAANQARLEGEGGLGNLGEVVAGAAAIEANFGASERLLGFALANEASTELVRQQAENNAFQQTIEDVTRIAPPTPGGVIQPGLAQDIQMRAARANSVRQSMNVLTDGLAAMMRTEAVLTGAVIENLQANSRQQSITNHQLTQLAEHLVEQATAEANEEINAAVADLRAAESEVDRAFSHLRDRLDDFSMSFEPSVMLDYGFNFCAMFPGSCRR